MQQFFGLVNSLLGGDPGTARRHLGMIVYRARHLPEALPTPTTSHSSQPHRPASCCRCKLAWGRLSGRGLLNEA